MNIKKFALTLLSVLSATSLWAAPEHVYSALPYEPATPHEFQSDWEGKLVIHPEAFGTFDLTKYKYSVSVKTDTGVQVGFAQWSDNDTKESNFSQEDDGVSGEFTVELSPARVRSIVNDGYCLQFNKGGTGKLYYVRLVTTERDPSEVEIDFSAKGFTTQRTKIIDGNGNILENGKCMLWGEYGIERTSTECTIFSTHPGGPGLAYQYPTGPFEHDIYNPAGGHGYEGEIEEPETGTYKDPVAIIHDSETGDNSAQWNHVYTISPETFADHNIAKGGKLSITLNGDGSNPEAAAYYNHTEADYDHNANGSDHLIGDYHDGPYYYVSVGNEYKKETVLTQAHVDALTTYGLRIDASHSNLGSVSYAALDVTLEIDDIAGDTDTTATPDAIYTLSGIRVSEMRPGEIYIVVRNGRATKELHR